MLEHDLTEAIEALGALARRRREGHQLEEIARRGRPVVLRDVDLGELLDRVRVVRMRAHDAVELVDGGIEIAERAIEIDECEVSREQRFIVVEWNEIENRPRRGERQCCFAEASRELLNAHEEVAATRSRGGRLASELERVAVSAEMLGNERATERELLVAEHALAGSEIAIDEIGGRPISELERQGATRIEGIGVARIFDQGEVVGARRFAVSAELVAKTRDVEPRRGLLRRDVRLRNAQGGELGERGEVARHPMVACEHAERGRMAELGAPQLVCEIERGFAVAGDLGGVEARRERRLGVDDFDVRAAAGCAREELGPVGGARGRRRFFVEPCGFTAAPDRFVALCERRAHSGNRGIEGECLLEVDLRLGWIAEPLLKDQRELHVQGTVIAGVRSGGDLAIQQRRDERPFATHHRGRTQLIRDLRICGRARVRLFEAAIRLGIAAERRAIELRAPAPQAGARLRRVGEDELATDRLGGRGDVARGGVERLE